MFWEELSPADRRAIEGAGIRRRYETGSPIFFEGDEPSFAVIILSGRIKLTTSSIDGKELLLELRGPGSLIGELGVVNSEPRSAGATTLDTVTAIVISSKALRDLLARRGEIALAVLAMVAGRLRQSSRRRLEDGTSDVIAKVCRRLIELAEDAPVSSDGTIVLPAPLTQQELADWTGASRDAVVLALRRLRESEWIETGRRRVVIHDLMSMKALAES